jgi:hypothetical protein
MQIRELTEAEREELLRWYLKGQHYAEGVRLYIKYGKNKSLKNQMRMKETEYLRLKLMQEMSVLVDVALGDRD